MVLLVSYNTVFIQSLRHWFENSLSNFELAVRVRLKGKAELGGHGRDGYWNSVAPLDHFFLFPLSAGPQQNLTKISCRVSPYDNCKI